MPKKVNLYGATENQPLNTYEYSDLASGRKIIFLAKDPINKLWEPASSEELTRRDQCFNAIYEIEKDRLTTHSVIEIDTAMINECEGLKAEEKSQFSIASEGFDKEALKTSLEEAFFILPNDFDAPRVQKLSSKQIIDEPRKYDDRGEPLEPDCVLKQEELTIELQRERQSQLYQIPLELHLRKSILSTYKVSKDEVLEAIVNAIPVIRKEIEEKKKEIEKEFFINGKISSENYSQFLKKSKTIEKEILDKKIKELLDDFEKIGKERYFKEFYEKVKKEIFAEQETIIWRDVLHNYWEWPITQKGAFEERDRRLEEYKKNSSLWEAAVKKKAEEKVKTLLGFPSHSQELAKLLTDLIFYAKAEKKIEDISATTLLDDKTKAKQSIVDKQASSSKFTTHYNYSVKSNPSKASKASGSVSIDSVAKAPQYAYQVHKLALEKLSPNYVSRSIGTVLKDFLSEWIVHPASKLINSILSKEEKPVFDPAEFIHPVSHETLGSIDHHTMLGQLLFVSSLFDRFDSSNDIRGNVNGTSTAVISQCNQVHKTLNEAYEMGNLFLQARDAGDKTVWVKEDKKYELLRNQLITSISERLDKVFNGSSSHCIIPLGMGEGKDYTTHFLIFERNPHIPSGVLVKHIHLSAPTVDRDRIQTVTSFGLDVPRSLDTFVRSLVTLQPFEDKLHADEKTAKASIHEKTLNQVLLEYGKQVKETTPVLQKASRDPVKIIFSVIKQLEMKPTESGDEKAFTYNSNPQVTPEQWQKSLSPYEKLTATKANFYMHYVNYLIEFLNSNDQRLTAQQQVRMLESVQWYTEKLKHYLEKEMGVEVALNITSSLFEFVQQKIIEQQEQEKVETKDKERLNSKVSLFSAQLKTDLSQGLTPEKKVERKEVKVDVYRTPQESLKKIELLKKAFDFKDFPKEMLNTLHFKLLDFANNPTPENKAKLLKWFEDKFLSLTGFPKGAHRYLQRLETILNEFDDVVKAYEAFAQTPKTDASYHVVLDNFRATLKKFLAATTESKNLYPISPEYEGVLSRILSSKSFQLDRTNFKLLFTNILQSRRAEMLIDDVRKERKNSVFQQLSALNGEVESLLESNKPKEAKVLASEILRALPPAFEFEGRPTFWTTLKTKEELHKWVELLETVGERTWEATVRIGAYPLPPREAFEFNTLLPLIQRQLYSSLLPLYQNDFDAIMGHYHTDADTVDQLWLKNKELEKIRKEELTKETLKRLKEIFKDEDKDFKVSRKDYTNAVKHYDKDYAKWKLEEAKWKKEEERLKKVAAEWKANNPGLPAPNFQQASLRKQPDNPRLTDARYKEFQEYYTELQKWEKEKSEWDATELKRWAAEKEKWAASEKAQDLKRKIAEAKWEEKNKIAPFPNLHLRPERPTFQGYEEASLYDRDSTLWKDIQVATREQRKEEEITESIKNDGFLQDLIKIEVEKLATNWNRLSSNFQRNDGELMATVVGHFMRIIGVNKELFAYAYYANHKGFNAVFANGQGSSSDEAILAETENWMMGKDFSLLFGDDVEAQTRYESCLNAFHKLYESPKNCKISSQYATNFIIGYDSLGNELHIEDEKELSKLHGNVSAYQNGIGRSEEAYKFLTPKELIPIKKMDEMKRMMEFPETVKRHFVYGGQTFGNALQNGGVNVASAKKEGVFQDLKGSHRLFLVPAKETTMFEIETYHSYVISNSPDSDSGKYCLGKKGIFNGEVKEITTNHRDKYYGDISEKLLTHTVPPDGEREEILDVLIHPECGTDSSTSANYEFLLRQTALGKLDSTFSSLSVSQCLHFMYQSFSINPELLEKPKVQHILYGHMFQKGLVRELLQRNPHFFLKFAPLLNKMIVEAAKRRPITELFLLEVTERIRQQALALKQKLEENLSPSEIQSRTERNTLLDKISNALPPYDYDRIMGGFLREMSSTKQKTFAISALLYFVKFPPDREDSKVLEKWNHFVKAYAIYLRSPSESGEHSGVAFEMHQSIQAEVLPKLESFLKADRASRQKLLNMLSNSNENMSPWLPEEGSDYRYYLNDDQGRRIRVLDIRSGEGVEIEVSVGQRGLLPEKVRENKDYQFLFGNTEPVVTTSGDTIKQYNWIDKTSGISYEIRFDQLNSIVQIFQIKDKQYYRFNRAELKKTFWGRFSDNSNKTIEKMIVSKGIWVRLSESDTLDFSHVYLAQKKQSLESPIRLWIKKDRIQGASVGEGEERLWVCSGTQADASLFRFRAMDNLLLLSKDKKQLDEIRFADGLTLKRSNADPEKWVIAGKEDWEWQLTETEDLQKRFGKQYREYLLPLRRMGKDNKPTGEEEFYIYPYNASSFGKKGNELQFNKTFSSLISSHCENIAKKTLEQMGIGLDFEEMQGLLGTVEDAYAESKNFLNSIVEEKGGTFEKLATEFESVQKENALGPIAEKFGGGVLNFSNDLFVPRPIRLTRNTKEERGAHLGFMYLSHVASLRGDWGTASRYLNQMVDLGVSNEQETEQLYTFVRTLLMFDFLALINKGLDLTALLNDPKNAASILVSPGTKHECAYRLKRILSLLRVQKNLEALHKRPFGLLDFFKDFSDNMLKNVEETKGIDKVVSENTGKMLEQAYIAVLACSYNKALSTDYALFEEQGLVLSTEEEITLQMNLCSVSGVVVESLLSVETPVKQVIVEPLRYSIPTRVEIETFLDAMIKDVNIRSPKSIQELHKTKGIYPKWNTLLAHFWDYWEWIDKTTKKYGNDEFPLQEGDLAFLLHEIPSSVKDAEAVDVARRLLLLFFNFKQKDVAHNGLEKNPMTSFLMNIQEKRKEMFNWAHWQEEVDLRKKGLNSPSKSVFGKFLKIATYFGYREGLKLFMGWGNKPVDKVQGGKSYYNEGQAMEYKGHASMLIQDIFLDRHYKTEIRDNYRILPNTHLVHPELDVDLKDPVLYELPVSEKQPPIQALDTPYSIKEKFLDEAESEFLKAFVNNLIIKFASEKFGIQNVSIDSLSTTISLMTGGMVNIREMIQKMEEAILSQKKVFSPLIRRIINIVLLSKDFDKGVANASTALKDSVGIYKDLVSDKDSWNEATYGIFKAEIANAVNPLESAFLWTFDAQKPCIRELHWRYYQTIEKPKDSEPKWLNLNITPGIDPKKTWNGFFKHNDQSSHWNDKAEKDKRYFSNDKLNPLDPSYAMEVHANSKECEGIDRAKKIMTERTQRSLDLSNLKNLEKKLNSRLDELKQETQKGRKEVLDFVKKYAFALDLMPLYSDPGRFKENDVLRILIDRMASGEINHLEDKELRLELVQILTHYLLAATEEQQLKKAKVVQKGMYDKAIKMVELYQSLREAPLSPKQVLAFCSYQSHQLEQQIKDGRKEFKTKIGICQKELLSFAKIHANSVGINITEIKKDEEVVKHLIGHANEIDNSKKEGKELLVRISQYKFLLSQENKIKDHEKKLEGYRKLLALKQTHPEFKKLVRSVIETDILPEIFQAYDITFDFKGDALDAFLKDFNTSREKGKIEIRRNVVQMIADHDINWSLSTRELHTHLSEGSNRLRYTIGAELERLQNESENLKQDLLAFAKEQKNREVLGITVSANDETVLDQLLSFKEGFAKNERIEEKKRKNLIFKIESYQASISKIHFLTPTVSKTSLQSKINAQKQDLLQFVKNHAADLRLVGKSDEEILRLLPSIKEDLLYTHLNNSASKVWQELASKILVYKNSLVSLSQIDEFMKAKGIQSEVVDFNQLYEPQFAFKYLAEDYKKQQITREKAKEAIENMLLRKVRFVKVRMGVGKSTFIFPMIARLSIEKGREPVIMTTEELLPQLLKSMDNKSFVFDFDIHFGLSQGATDREINTHLATLEKALYALKSEGRYVATTPGRLAALRDKRIQLEDKLFALRNDPPELRNSVFEQLNLLKKVEAFFRRENIIYYQDEDVNLDISFEYNFAAGEPRKVDNIRFNMTEKFVQMLLTNHTVDFRKDKDAVMLVPEIMQNGQGKMNFAEMLLDNTLRSLSDPTAAMKQIAIKLYEDTEFWKSVGWKEEVWNKIDKDQFVEYVLGRLPDGRYPANLPQWDVEEAAYIKKQKEKGLTENEIDKNPPHMCYVSALKMIMSSTFKSVYQTHAELDRGVSLEKDVNQRVDGCTVVPYRDGMQKRQTQYGEETEIILHHFFHYVFGGIDETRFVKLFEELKKIQDVYIYPSRETERKSTDPKWYNWAAAIESCSKSNPVPAPTLNNPHATRNLSLYEAFCHRSMYKERLQLLRYIMMNKGTEFVRIYPEQIVCNSQDVTLGAEVFVGSGTGDVYALNLADAQNDMSSEPDEISGETFLAIDLDEELEVGRDIFDDPYEFMKRMAQNPKCCAIINRGYEIENNQTEKLVQKLRQVEGIKNRQILFCSSKSNKDDEATQPETMDEALKADTEKKKKHSSQKKSVQAAAVEDLDRLIWNPGAPAPIRYEETAVDYGTVLGIYAPKNTRGTDFKLPTGKGYFGVLMVDLGTTMDEFNQALGRLRRLGQGQNGKIALDPKMAKRVRELNPDLAGDPSKKIRVGHVVNAIKKKTIKDDEVRHVKAAIFKAREPFKLQIDKVYSEPYNLENIPKEKQYQLHDLENLITKHHRFLYIVNNTIQWAREIRPQVKNPSPQVLLELYQSQLELAEKRRKEFFADLAELAKKDKIFSALQGMPIPLESLLASRIESQLSALIKSKKIEDSDKNLVREILSKVIKLNAAYNTIADQISELCIQLDPKIQEFLRLAVQNKWIRQKVNFEVRIELLNESLAEFEKELYKKVEMDSSKPPKEFSVLQANLLMQKAAEMETATETTTLNAQIKKMNEDHQKTLQFINNNLPAKMESCGNGMGKSTSSQQQVQSQVQQETQVEQETNIQLRQNVLEPSSFSRYTRPLDYAAFKSFAEGAMTSEKQRLPSDTFERVRDQSVFYHHLPDTLRPHFNNLYISERAKELLKQLNRNGFPNFYLLTIENSRGAYHTCIVSPGEWVETIDPALNEERTSKSSTKVALYAMSINHFERMEMDMNLLEPDVISNSFWAQHVAAKWFLNWNNFHEDETGWIDEQLESWTQGYKNFAKINTIIEFFISANADYVAQYLEERIKTNLDKKKALMVDEQKSSHLFDLD